MIRLARVEVLRFVSRRLTQVLTVLVLVAIAVTGVIVAVRSEGPSAAQYRDARTERAANVRACAKHPTDYRVQAQPGETPQQACDRQIGPVSDWVPDERFDLRDLGNIFLGTSFLLAAIGLIVGASFVGAEWHWGTAATLLTWESRRTRVILVKAFVCVVTVFVLLLGLQLVFGVVLWLDAVTRGITEGTDAAWLRSVTGHVVRAAALGSFAAAVGLAIATVGRNTAAALGAGAVYFGVVEGLVRALRPSWQRWLIGDNAVLFRTGTDNRYPPLDRSTTSSGLVLLAYSVVLVATAVAWFRARDL